MNQPIFGPPNQPIFGLPNQPIFGPPNQPIFGPSKNKQLDIKKLFNDLPKPIKYIIAIFIVSIIIYIILLTQSKDGYFAEWSDWSACSKPCNGGEHYKTRKYIPKTLFGKDLVNKDNIKEIESCNIDPCPINGYHTEWINEGKCVEKENSANEIICGNGKQKQIRNYIKQQYGGIDLPVTEQKNLIRWVVCNKDPCQEASVSIWKDIIIDNKKYYYLDNNNIKKYINDMDINNNSCYDPTIKISNKLIEKSDIKLDQERIYIPGEIEELSIKNLLKKNYPKDSDITINNKYTLLKNSNWIETQTITPNLLPCSAINAVYTPWQDPNECICNGSGKDIDYLTANLTRTKTRDEKYGGIDIDKEKGIISKFIRCDKNYKKLNYTESGLCPINGKLTSWNIANTNNIDSKGCSPIYGKDRKIIRKATYIWPIETGIHSEYITINFDLNSKEFKSLNLLDINNEKILSNLTNTSKIKFKRREDNKNAKVFELEEITNCEPNPQFTDNDLKNNWKSITECEKELTDDILIKYNPNMNIEDYKYESNNTSFITAISNWTKKNILKYTIKDLNREIMKDNTNILKQCYDNLPLKLNNLNQKEYIDPPNNIIYPGIQYSDGFQWKKGKFTLIIQSNGNFCIYKDYDLKNLNNDLYWSSETEENSKGYLYMQEDGNLVIYDKDNNAKWSSGTFNNNSGYAELILSKSGNYPLLVIKDKDGKIIKYLNKITLNLINNNKYIYKNKYLELDGGEEEVLNDPTCIYPYIKYYNNFKWSNNNFNLIIQKDSNLVIYKDNKTSGASNAIWSTRTNITNETFHYRYLILQPDGNLVIYDANNNAKWYSNTSNQVEKNTKFYGEITNNGYLSILNKDNKVIKAYPENIVSIYIKDIHWKNSPWTLFADKKNRVWKAFWSDLDKERLDKEYKDGADYSRFNGIRKNSDNIEWKKQGELHLNHIEGYNVILNNSLPKYDEDNNDFNYNTSNDRENFNKNPPIIIPGYNIISKVNGTSASDTSNFLISARTGTKWDQAFVLYKLKNQNDYFNDLINNNKLLVRTMIDKDIMKNIIGGSNSGFTETYRNNLKSKNNVSAFTNKIINTNLDIENFINYRIKQKNNFSNKIYNSYLESVKYF